MTDKSKNLQKDAYIERLRKLAATPGEWIRRMQNGEL